MIGSIRTFAHDIFINYYRRTYEYNIIFDHFVDITKSYENVSSTDNVAVIIIIKFWIVNKHIHIGMQLYLNIMYG